LAIPLLTSVTPAGSFATQAMRLNTGEGFFQLFSGGFFAMRACSADHTGFVYVLVSVTSRLSAVEMTLQLIYTLKFRQPTDQL